MKIEIGKQYKVHGTEEDGNVIKITEKKNGLCRYETISGKQPFVNQFECGSLFARLLTPYNEEDCHSAKRKYRHRNTIREYGKSTYGRCNVQSRRPL